MAVIVEVMSTVPNADWPAGQNQTGSIYVSVTGDYLCPAPIQTQMTINFENQPNRQAAIEHCLQKLAKAAEQIKEGAEQAAAQHPPGT